MVWRFKRFKNLMTAVVLRYYKDIQNEANELGNIPYLSLLNTFEWKSFREKIIQRDNSICVKCNSPATQKLNPDDLGYFRKPTSAELDQQSKPIEIDWGNGITSKMSKASIIGMLIENPTILHVHHLYYIWENLPWEYDLDALVTVCHSCHNDIHENQVIPVYSDSSLKTKIDVKICQKCHGKGYLGKYHYFHDGICFSCLGNKFTRS